MSYRPSPSAPPEAASPPRARLLSRGYWAMICLAALCLVGAAIVGLTGSRLIAGAAARGGHAAVAPPGGRTQGR